MPKPEWSSYAAGKGIIDSSGLPLLSSTALRTEARGCRASSTVYMLEVSYWSKFRSEER